MSKWFGVCCYYACGRAPSFAPRGTKKALRCASHRLGSDVNVRHKPCCSPGCARPARYGNHSSTKTRCSSHKTGDDDIDLSVRRCVFPGCPVPASYLPVRVGGKPVRCASHRMEGDVPVVSCAVSSCNSTALSLNDSSSGVKHCVARFDASTDTGILHLACQTKGCAWDATHGDVQNKPLRCLRHKSDTDRDVVHAMCGHERCVRRLSFDPAGSEANRCKTDGDVDVSAKRCSAEAR